MIKIKISKLSRKVRLFLCLCISYEQGSGVMNRGRIEMLWGGEDCGKKLSTEMRKVINRLCITIHTYKGVDSWKYRVGIE